MKIAIIGAGLAGLACAGPLKNAGHNIQLFDKARGPGGRMSTRRAQTPAGEAQFDHGAQYFTVRDPAFQQLVDSWARDGVAARWPAAGEDAWVGTPAMNSPIKAMAAGQDIAWATRIDQLEKSSNCWKLLGEKANIDTLFDSVILAIPAEQTADLLSPVDTGFAAVAQESQSDPCWTVMLSFSEKLPTDQNILRNIGAIGWAARNSDKPGRTGLENWVVQASPAWSRDHLEETQEWILPTLIEALSQALGLNLPEPLHATAHRWRYARSDSADRTALFNRENGLGVCGDWLLGPRVENAWLSGTALSQHILDQ
ncbi:MAG: FAD-dependent oxidoreductase [Parasphingorhabdus sp.]|uniref:NAD(P)/FAD-dependent oxidoreductase n=1 Tax=Parasphingorhabdus sp. TaxID=2709688 RepID=UPI00329943EE